MLKNKLILKIGLMFSSIIVPTVALTSCSSITTSIYFAELVLSDNTSVLKDKSFNENSYNGWRKFMIATEFDPITGNVITPEDKDDKNITNSQTKYSKKSIDMPKADSTSKLLVQGRGIWRRPNKSKDLTYRQIFSGGSNLIIAPGFNNQQAIETVASQEKDKGFLFLDGVPQLIKDASGNLVKEYPNVSSFLFRGEQSGFLAGVAAGEFLNINKDIFTKDDEELKVGGFVGLPFGSTVDFLAGFQHGIIAYNEKIKSDSTKKQIMWVETGNEIGNYASNSFSPGQGIQKSRELIDKGADIIIPIAGAQISDLISAINNQTKPRPVSVVGVDSVQEENWSIQKEFDRKIIQSMGGKKMKDADGNILEKQNIIQFSAEKKVDKATTKVLAAIFNKNKPNNFDSIESSVVKGLGYLNTGSLGNETTGVSNAGLPYVFKAFPEWEKKENGKSTGILDATKVYQNQEFISLETNGVLYKDISKWKNGDGQNIVKASIYESNKLVSPIENGQYSLSPTPLFDDKNGKMSLDGSKWGLKKGEFETFKNKEIIVNRKYE